jgi:hypothetical protein
VQRLHERRARGVVGSALKQQHTRERLVTAR